MIRGLVLILVTSVVLVGNAHAAPPICRLDPDFNPSGITGPDCGYAQTCSYCQGTDVCLDETTPQVCGDSKGENLYCCSGCACPDIKDYEGTCADSVDACLYPDIFDYCMEPADLTIWQFVACYSAPGGTRVRRWEDGDCDSDGVANSMDCEPCAAGAACATGGTAGTGSGGTGGTGTGGTGTGGTGTGGTGTGGTGTGGTGSGGTGSGGTGSGGTGSGGTGSGGTGSGGSGTGGSATGGTAGSTSGGTGGNGGGDAGSGGAGDTPPDANGCSATGAAPWMGALVLAWRRRRRARAAA